MPRITVAVESTIWSSIGRHDGPVSDESDATGRSGWPVGKGCVEDTLDTDGRPIQTMVLMQEPALPGDEIAAWPEAADGMPEGAKFETFASLDRILGLELIREIGRVPLPEAG
ncbi:hypothetical protein [Streptomyces sp. NPDC088246]|uniref:hypothetical protein n=1 Tax=Streptomyces sp. NPDC088246 TaxID=3365842 RepID=UPI00380F894D